MSDPLRIFDEDALAQHRARAHARLSDHDFLVQRAAHDMAERLTLIQRTFENVSHVGIHSAFFTQRLADLQTSHQIENITCIAQPVGKSALALDPQSQNLITSILSLHHVNDLPGLLIQIQRALKPDGLFLATLFGGDTLTELRQAFLQAEAELEGGASPHVSPFATVQDMGSLLQRAGFALPVIDTDLVTVSYAHPLKLLAELRGMGETNILRERRKSFSRRSTFLRMCEIYQERFSRDDGRVTATFAILTMTGWAPHDSQQQPLQPGSGDVSLTDIFDRADPDK